MASAQYSFIDIAVLEGVRERFAAGEALAVLAIDLERILWANGPGAALFGYPDIEAAIDAAPNLSLTARRQITATPGFPDIGRDRAVTVRMAGGLTSRVVGFLASAIALPGGERAVLLALPGAQTRSQDAQERSRNAIGGFNEPGHFAAFVDADGNVTAASNGFDDLGIGREILRQLVAEVRGEDDRLVKKLIAGEPRRFPAGFARLTDAPAMHFLVVVDEGDTAIADDSTPASAALPETPVPEPAQAEESEAVTAPAEGAAIQDTQPSQPAAPFAPAAEPAPRPIQPDPELHMVRFAWRTDAESRFSSISEEFAAAVGAPAADIIGRRFQEVSDVFGLDPSGEIAALLVRRDTWSGRTVMWPVAGTDRKIPVDLAALPIYGRGRTFEGFRGFGIARAGDAVPDPEAIGLALAPSIAQEPGQPKSKEQPAGGEITTGPAEPDDTAPVIDETREEPRPDKVIHLAEHRVTQENGLSATERTAFREIGDRLRRDSGSKDEEPASPDETATRDNAEPVAEDTTPAQATAGAGTAAAEPEAEAAPPDAEHDGDDAVAAPEPSETPDESGPMPEAQAEDAGGDAVDTEAEAAFTSDAIEPAAAAETPDALEPAVAEVPETVDPSDRSPVTVLPSAFFGALREASRAGMDTSVLALLPVAILIHAGDALHYANDEFFQLTGYRDLDALAEGGGIGALFADPYEDDVTETADGRTLRLLTAMGDEHPVEAHLRSVPWGDGKALLLAVRRVETATMPVPPAADASAPASEAAELEERLAEMRAIIDTATDGAVVIDNDGNIRSMNRPAEALFGFDAKHVAGKPFSTLFAMESQRAVQDYLAGLSGHGVASVLNDGREAIGREAQGRFIPLFMTIGRLPSDSGYCAVLRDITQWKRAEEELTQARAEAERASSQKTEFLARVSHEIRTPLNAIIGFSELMIDEKFGAIGNERYRDYLRDINRSGNHVLDLVNDLLDISKIEAGEQEMHYEAVSLNEALSETVAMMQPQANRERVIIRSSFASRLPEVVADQRSVRQIALNLLSNAVRYTPAGGQVIVSTAYDADGSVAIRVRDTGVGMSGAEIEEALKPFKQINSLKRKRGEGTGLGLPLTRAMVEANRARFAINSTPGEGTLVEVTFPSTRVLAD